MRTTVEIPDDLFRRAKRLALERDSTLKDLIARALERELAGDPPEARIRVKFPLVEVGPDCPILHLSIDQIKEIEEREEAEKYRDLLAGR